MLQPGMMGLVVNGEAIEETEIREEVRSLRPRYFETMRGADPIAAEIQLREWSRENVIERALLRQEAARREITVEALVEAISSKVPVPRYRDVGDFYKKNKEDFWMPDVIHVAHIVKNVDENVPEERALAVMQEAEAELKAGVAFAAVAAKFSDCPDQGGVLGWFPPGEMVVEFDAVVFKLAAGQTSGIFRTMFGFHIARVLDRRAAGVPGLMHVRDQIETMLRKVKQEKVLENFVDALKARAVIEG